jgi:UDPglucose--hexose-1-phosphate uridylyltransferase
LHVLDLIKPDGRRLALYGRDAISGVGAATSPRAGTIAANPHLRWHPLRGEWVAYAAYRQERTFLPPPEYNPLRPGSDPAVPTELPEGHYDIAVFDNLFPSLSASAHDPPELHIPTEPGLGRCEVVVYTQDPGGTLAELPTWHLKLLLDVLGDRTQKLGADKTIRYVLPFENRGTEMGVTLHHPHGQIYAYPMIPPTPARMLACEQEHFHRTGTGLLTGLLARELELRVRILYEGKHAVAFVPPWARYPYETWIAPKASAAFLHELDDDTRRDLGLALKIVLLKYDRLWQRPMPYIMTWYQAPTDGAPHPECHLHAELLPPYRTRDKLKYLAGTELGGGMFASDVLPEDAAARLAAVDVGASADVS